MGQKLTERMEIRISKKQKAQALKISKRYNDSIGWVLREGLKKMINSEKDV